MARLFRQARHDSRGHMRRHVVAGNDWQLWACEDGIEPRRWIAPVLLDLAFTCAAVVAVSVAYTSSLIKWLPAIASFPERSFIASSGREWRMI